MKGRTNTIRGIILAVVTLSALVPLHAEWPVAIGGALTGPPVIDHSGTLYVLAEDRYLYAFDPAGNRQWRIDVGSLPAAGPAMCPGGGVIVGTRDGRLRAVSPAGTPLWTHSLTETAAPQVAGSPADGSEGSVDASTRADAAPMAPYCDEEGFVHMVSRNGSIRRISPSGLSVWRRHLQASPILPPVSDTRGRIYVPTDGDVVEVLGADGKPLERLPTAGRVRAQAVVGDWYVAGTGGGELIGYGPEGELRRRSLGVLGEDGVRQIVGSADGRTFVLTGAGRLLSLHTPWPEGTGAPTEIRTPVPRASRLEGLRANGAEYELFVAGPSVLHRLVIAGDGRELRRSERVLTSYAGRRLTTSAVGFRMAVVQSEEWILSAVELSAADGTGPPADGTGPPADGTGPPVDGPAWTGARGSPLRSGFPIGRARVDRSTAWQENLDYLFLESHLISRSREDRRRALEDIEQRVESGTLLGATDYVVALLRRAAFQDFRGPSAGSTGFGDLRARVVRLLGRIGGRSAVRDLTQLASYSYTAAVDAEILTAFARVPGAVTDQGMSAITEILRRHGGSGPGESGNAAVGRAAVKAIAALLVYEGRGTAIQGGRGAATGSSRGAPGGDAGERGAGSAGSTAGELLADIVSGDYPRSVREEALRVLRGR